MAVAVVFLWLLLATPTLARSIKVGRRSRSAWPAALSGIDTRARVLEEPNVMRNTNKTAVPLLCSLCQNKGSTAFPEKDVTPFLPQDMMLLLLSQSPPNNNNGTTTNITSNSSKLTCTKLGEVVSKIPAAEPRCLQVRQALAGLCGCPPIPDHCQFCTHLPFPNRTVRLPTGNTPPRPLTCQEMSFVLGQVPSHNNFCRRGSFPLSVRCDCPPTDLAEQNAYAGASTETKRKAIVWVSRATAIVSACSSVIILWDIFRQMRKRRRAGNKETPVKLILITCISFFSLLLSIAFALGSSPNPETEEEGDASFFWGSRGNDATCKTQGFLKQLGMTGFCYFVSLSSYYLLVIRYGWTETNIRKVQYYFHLPMLVGVVLAFAGIPFYDSTPLGCYFRGPPGADSYLLLLIFNFIPIWTTVLLSTICLFLVYASVRRKERSANRWRLKRNESGWLPEQFLKRSTTQSLSVSSRKTSRRATRRGAKNKRKRSMLEKAVFFQCLSYFLATAFPATFLTFVLVTADVFHGEENIYWLFLFFVAVAPCQGFFYALVYFRPQICSSKSQKSDTRNASQLKSGSVDSAESSSGLVKEDPVEIQSVERLELKANNTVAALSSANSFDSDEIEFFDDDSNWTAELQRALANGEVGT